MGDPFTFNFNSFGATKTGARLGRVQKFTRGWQKSDGNARIIVLICTNSMSIETKPTACQ